MTLATSDALARARAAGRRAALVTVVRADAGAAVDAGARLVVDESGERAGELGDPRAEDAAVELARAALAGHAGASRRVDVAGDPSGDVELTVEVHEPQPAVLVLGSTAPAYALAAVAAAADHRTLLVAVGGAVGLPPQVEVRADEPARLLLAAPPGPGDAVFVADSGASWAVEALRVALASEAAYVGLVAADDASRQLRRRLLDAGVPEGHLERLHAPAGVDAAEAGSPGEAAVAAVAEMQAQRRRQAGASRPGAGGDAGGPR